MKFINFIVLPILTLAKTHPSCFQILQTWWKERIDHPFPQSIWDITCKKFNNDRQACVYKKRDYYFKKGIINEYERDSVSCLILGAHSKKCISNPCSHYNIGKCTIQQTGGLCNWFTKKEAKKYNLQYGCHTNPCHIGGLGKTSSKNCIERGIPGFINCTYCSGKKLKGKGMGCQRTDVTTSSQCAPVNSGIPPKNTIYRHISKKNCQCTNINSFCKIDINNGNYVPIKP